MSSSPKRSSRFGNLGGFWCGRFGLGRSGWVIGFVLVVAVLLRFSALDRAVYWYDETITSVRIAGYTKEQVEDFFQPQGRPVFPADLVPLQRSGDHPWLATLHSLATETPDQVPLYYLLLRGWTHLAGDSVAAIRAFSALVSLLVFPALVLFGQAWLADWPRDRSVIGLAIGLVAVSPIQVVYAREARGYSLAVVLFLLASWALLRVLRFDRLGKPTRSAWMTYGVLVACNFYGHLPLALGIAAQGAYVALRGWLERSHRGWNALRHNLLAWGGSLLGALVLFSPWLVCWLTYRKPMGWIDRELTWGTLVQRWGLNFSAIALDWQACFDRPLFDITQETDPIALSWHWLPIGLLLVMVALSSQRLLRVTPPDIWLFPLLTGAIALPFALLDAVDGGQRSTIARYFLPAYLALTWLLAFGLSEAWANQRRRPWAVGAIALLWVVGLWSSSQGVMAPTWWNKYSSYDDPAIAQRVSELQPPVVISGNALRLLALARRLPSQAQLIYLEEPDLTFPETIQRAIAYRPKTEWLDRLKTNPRYQIQAIEPFNNTWVIQALDQSPPKTP